MTPKTASSLAVAAAAVLVGVALVTAPTGSKFKRAYAAGWLAVGLAFLADVAPGLVGPFAIAIGLGVIVSNPGVFGKITSGQGSSTITPTPTTGQTGAYGATSPRSNLPG